MEEEYTQNINPSIPTSHGVAREIKGHKIPQVFNNHLTNRKETCLKSINEPCSSNNKGLVYEEQRLQIEEPDEWRTHKPKPRHDRLNVLSNQLKVGDKVVLDVADPYITTFEPNGAIPFTVLNFFPYGTVEVTHSKFGTFKVNSTRLKHYFDKIDSRNEECKLLAPP
ncbi:hypothetical protein GOBAR_AA31078 [Gossypium barbadense]|uniref:Uncharacterized protein n=1 Tax=Gossypium barbadense TaxID=3634 RepID=A0A2P5WEU7_GOSBA|nr:hypothetical protein GOBAR_AA31078 [Gossypium barbadense]